MVLQVALRLSIPCTPVTAPISWEHPASQTGIYRPDAEHHLNWARLATPNGEFVRAAPEIIMTAPPKLLSAVLKTSIQRIDTYFFLSVS